MLRKQQIEKVLKILCVDASAPIIREDGKWRRTDVPFTIDTEHMMHLAQQRELEWKVVQDYINSSSCLMQYLCRALDDITPSACGKCASCLRKPIIDIQIDLSVMNLAARFLQQIEILTKEKRQTSKPVKKLHPARRR